MKRRCAKRCVRRPPRVFCARAGPEHRQRAGDFDLRSRIPTRV